MADTVKLKFWTTDADGMEMYRTVPAVVRGPLALHRPMTDNLAPGDGWAISHVATGCRVARFHRQDVARWALRWLAGRFGWLCDVRDRGQISPRRLAQLQRAELFARRMDVLRYMQSCNGEPLAPLSRQARGRQATEVDYAGL